MTFTDRAAAELRNRIRERVRERMPEREDVSAELEAAQISTLHALCARICREHPDEANVPPDFGILSDLRGRLWTADRVLDAMDGLPLGHYRVVPYPLMQAALEVFFADPIAAEQALEKGPEEWDTLVTEARRSALEAILDDPILEDGQRILESHLGAEGDLMEEARSAALSALAGLEAARGSNVNPKPHFEALDGIRLTGGKKGNWGEGELPTVREALKAVRGLARAHLESLAKPAGEQMLRSSA